MAVPNPERTTLNGNWRNGAAFPWLVWGIGTVLYFYGFFHRVAPSVMVGDLMRDFAMGGAILGILSGLYFYPYAVLQLPLGLMLDRWGPRRVLTCAAAVCTLGTLLFATAGSLPAAYAGRVLIGAGAAFGWIGALSLVAIWFPPRRFALVAGITAMIGMTGAIGGQAPLAAVVASAGWRATLLGAAGFGAVLTIALWVIVRDKEQMEEQPAPIREPLWPGVLEVATNANVWAVGLVVATVSVPLLVFAGLWGVPYMMEAQGMSRTQAAGSTSLILLGWGIGAPLIGWFSDRIRSRRIPLLGGAILAFSAILGIIYIPGLPLWSVFILLFLNGFFGGSAVISYASCRESCRKAVSGTSMGFVNTILIVLSAVFQPLIGWFLDLGWAGRIVDGARIYSVGTYRMAFLSLVACAVVAVVAALLTRETHGLAPEGSFPRLKGGLRILALGPPRH